MPHKERGAMLILFIPVAAMAFFASLFLADWGRSHYLAGRIQTAADAALVSSLRIRNEGLSRVAERWEKFGRFFGKGDSAGIQIFSEHREEIVKEADKLKKALSGYKGRITAVVKVVLEANGVARGNLIIEEDDANKLGLVPESQWIRDEKGSPLLLPGAWYRRMWAVHERLGSPEERSLFRVSVRAPHLIYGGMWRIDRFAEGKLEWDAARDHPEVQTKGNGGFPRFWEEALDGHRVAPHRYPVYTALLKGSGE